MKGARCCAATLHTEARCLGFRQSRKTREAGSDERVAGHYDFKPGVTEEDKVKLYDLEGKAARLMSRVLEYISPAEAARWKEVADAAELPTMGGVGNPIGNLFSTCGYMRNPHCDNVYAHVLAIWYHEENESVGGGELCFW